MKPIISTSLKNGECFIQYYKHKQHKDIYVGQFIEDACLPFLRCRVIYQLHAYYDYDDKIVLRINTDPVNTSIHLAQEGAKDCILQYYKLTDEELYRIIAMGI